MQRYRDGDVGADLGGATRAAKELAERAREIGPIFVLQTSNRLRERAAIEPEREIDDVASGRVDGRRTRLDARRAGGAKSPTARDAGIACRAARWAQKVSDEIAQHERCIVHKAPSVALGDAASAAAAADAGGAGASDLAYAPLRSASATWKGRHSSSVSP